MNERRGKGDRPSKDETSLGRAIQPADLSPVELVLDFEASVERREQLLAQFTFKGHEFAEISNNWAL
jgi:hypothetical protein